MDSAMARPHNTTELHAHLDLATALAIVQRGSALIEDATQQLATRPAGERMTLLARPILELFCEDLGFDFAAFVPRERSGQVVVVSPALRSAADDLSPIVESMTELLGTTTMWQQLKDDPPAASWLAGAELAAHGETIAPLIDSMEIRALALIPVLAARSSREMVGALIAGGRAIELVQDAIVQLCGVLAGQLGTALGYTEGL